MGSRYVTKNGHTMRRGLFSNGVWHCDCDPRMPADKFQTKNGGKNHGRWFYTCQKPQPKRCKFFLWEDEAKVREEGAVLSNSRTEPADIRPPKNIGTPAKQTKLPAHQIPTPSTKTKSPPRLEAIEPPSSSPADDFDDWSVDDEDLAEALDEFETPHKAARRSYDDSPSKKRTISENSHAPSVTLSVQDEDPAEVYSTPATSKKAPPIFSNTPDITPSKTVAPPPSTPITAATAAADPGPLAQSVLTILKPLRPSPTLTTEITTLLNTHELRASGTAKGRDIARAALQTKDLKIAELEARIKALEMEKETMRSVVGCLKSDIANSPKRPRRPKEGGGEDEGNDGGGAAGTAAARGGYGGGSRGRSSKRGGGGHWLNKKSHGGKSIV
jgi:hypothetical protein